MLKLCEIDNTSTYKKTYISELPARRGEREAEMERR